MGLRGGLERSVAGRTGRTRWTGRSRRTGRAISAVALLCGLVTIGVAPRGAGAAPGGGSHPIVGTALAQSSTTPVRGFAHSQRGGAPREGLAHHPSASGPSTSVADSVRQSAQGTVAAPTSTSFEGTGNADSVVPPDPNGAVGPSAYFELVNTHFEIFSKAGAPLVGPTETAQLFSAFATAGNAAQLCYTNPGGDGIVLYDRAADRWVLGELAFSSSGGFPSAPYIYCVAVSQTSDPTGSYYAYAFEFDSSQLPDYPKLAVWGNSYYLSANMFASPFSQTSNAAVFALDRPHMLTYTSPVLYTGFENLVPSSYNTILPAQQDGTAPPPANAPELYGGLDFSTNSTFGLWQFSAVDWSTPGSATFGPGDRIAVAPYNTLCNLSQNCLAQPGTSQQLDAISDRVMNRLAYRNFGDHEALVVDHSVNPSGSGTQAGVRWYEFDRQLVSGVPSGAFSVAQQGTYAPDTTTSRWMGSTAMDGAGNLAIGYSAASSSLYPSIRFTGRQKADPAGQLTIAEGTIQAGGGSQLGYNRWGDYTDLSVDPADDCTFWYVDEYYATSSSAGWQTRIGHFKLPGCPAGPDFSLGASPASQTVTQGASTSYTVTVSPLDGFSSAVTLSATGLPSGATASFSPNPTSTTSTLQVTTAGSTPIGSYPLTISGTSGALTHTTTATLVVSPAGNFTLSSSPASQSVVQGNSTSYTVTVNPSGGFSAGVQLSVIAGLPSGATASFSPDPTSTTSTLTVTTASSTPTGTSTLTIRGTSGALSAQTTVGLTVNPGPHVLHIVGMNMYGQVGSRNWKAWADVTVDDQNNNPVGGVTVTFTFSGGTRTTRTCVTNSSGYCTTSSNPVTISLKATSESIVTSNVTESGYSWDGVRWGGTLTRP